MELRGEIPSLIFTSTCKFDLGHLGRYIKLFWGTLRLFLVLWDTIGNGACLIIDSFVDYEDGLR